jgi:hypothetical protein
MKNSLLYLLLFACVQAHAQDMMLLRLHAAEPREPFHEDVRQDLRTSNDKVIAVMGGLNDWDGANNYFNFFGSKVIIEKMDKTSYGSTTLVLRREDGKKFYGLYPIMKAEVIPFDSEILNVYGPSN